ncbi:MAG: acyltransferase [Acidimicrobiia bacterium]|nr:acyltransferase [Acidimicrobiia bacterium]
MSSDSAASRRPSLDELVAATPATRDRYLDLLRAASILVVVFGHWLMAVLEWDDGRLETSNLLAEVRPLQLATWVLQVMPVFFFVGGVVNRAAILSARRRGSGWAEYLQGRVDRLTRPVVPFALVWMGVAGSIALAGASGKPARVVLRVMAQPLWFLAVYLIVIAMAPAFVRLHERWRWWVPGVLALTAGMLDIVGEHVAGVGWANYPVVFLFAHQLGFFAGDGTLNGWPRHRMLLAGAVGLGALAALTAGPYPTSMVGVTGEARSNMSPPTLCIVALAVLQVALVLLARPAVARWLESPRAWGAVIVVNTSIMTIFLWHLPALVLVALLLLVGFPQPDVASASWWLLRIPGSR